MPEFYALSNIIVSSFADQTGRHSSWVISNNVNRLYSFYDTKINAPKDTPFDQEDNKRHSNLSSQCPSETSACVHAYTLYLLTLIKIIHWGNVQASIKGRVVCCLCCSPWAQITVRKNQPGRTQGPYNLHKTWKKNCFCTMWHFIEHIKARTLRRGKAYKPKVSVEHELGRTENSKMLSAGSGNISTDRKFSLC